MNKRIFVIGMLDSIHVARWLGQFRDQEIEFLLFPSSPHRRLHAQLKELLSSDSLASYSIVPLGKYFGLPFWILDKFVGNWIRGTLARLAMAKFEPDLVHALELQNAGYIALKALEGKKPTGLKLMTTNYGSDIYWFQRFEKHRDKLQRLMAISDYKSAECSRDLKLANDLGFKGQLMPVIPNAGGFSEELLSSSLTPSNERKVIAVKGYHGWVGRAKVALEAIAGMATELEDFEFVVYSANATTQRLAKRISREHALRFTIHGKGALSHSKVLELFGNSRIYVGLSESDGISTSLLEAMAMGAIPVQTATACCDEWFSDTGAAVTEITVPAVQDAIRRALLLSLNQDNADRNRETIRQKASASKVTEIAQGFYKL